MANGEPSPAPTHDPTAQATPRYAYRGVVCLGFCAASLKRARLAAPPPPTPARTAHFYSTLYNQPPSQPDGGAPDAGSDERVQLLGGHLCVARLERRQHGRVSSYTTLLLDISSC